VLLQSAAKVLVDDGPVLYGSPKDKFLVYSLTMKATISGRSNQY